MNPPARKYPTHSFVPIWEHIARVTMRVVFACGRLHGGDSHPHDPPARHAGYIIAPLVQSVYPVGVRVWWKVAALGVAGGARGAPSPTRSVRGCAAAPPPIS